MTEPLTFQPRATTPRRAAMSADLLRRVFDPKTPTQVPRADAEAFPAALDTPDDILALREPIRPEYLVSPYLPAHEIVEAYGPGGSLKSYVLIYLPMAVATGGQWGGHEVRAGRAGFVSLEDAKQPTLAMRIRGFVAGHPFTEEKLREAEQRERAELLRERFRYLGRDEARNLYLTDVDRGATRIRQRAVDAWSRLADGFDLLVMETVSRLHRGSENANDSVARFMDALEVVRDRTGATLIYLHHMSKEGTRKGTKDALGGRGAAAFGDNSRGVFAIERTSGERLAPVRLTHEKPPPYGWRGAPIVWAPVENEEGLFLEPLSKDAAVKEDAEELHRYLAAHPEGLTRSDLKSGRDVPKGLRVHFERQGGRGFDALRWLVAAGRVTRSEEKRGKNLAAEVYRAVLQGRPTG